MTGTLTKTLKVAFPRKNASAALRIRVKSCPPRKKLPKGRYPYQTAALAKRCPAPDTSPVLRTPVTVAVALPIETGHHQLHWTRSGAASEEERAPAYTSSKK